LKKQINNFPGREKSLPASFQEYGVGMILRWIVVLGVVLLAAQVNAEEVPVLQSGRDKVSYAVGVNLARTFKKQNIDVDLDLVMKGLRDGLSGERLLMPEREYRLVMQQFQGDVRRAMVLDLRTAAVENKKKGAEFLAANKTRDGVVTLPSGVQYTILKAGDGRKPTEADTVLCNYRGTLLDGTEFEASEPGKPVNMQVAHLIPGWKEAMKLMSVGSKWKLFIPPELAYGERSRGSEIVGPNETVTLEVELVAIK
jgi:FKBP-type peptidyl-prolyl cis-trans isomerase FklB